MVMAMTVVVFFVVVRSRMCVCVCGSSVCWFGGCVEERGTNGETIWPPPFFVLRTSRSVRNVDKATRENARVPPRLLMGFGSVAVPCVPNYCCEVSQLKRPHSLPVSSTPVSPPLPISLLLSSSLCCFPRACFF